MKKFVNIWFRNLPNAAHFDFCEKVAFELARAGATIQNVLAALIPLFREWLDKENALMIWVRKSELTAKIADSDHHLDRILGAISAQVRSAGYSDEPVVLDAAHRLKIMLKNYGKVSHKPYNEEAGDVRAILEQLTGDYAPDAATVGITGRASDLQAAYNEFAALLEQRDMRMIPKPEESFPVVRRGIEDVYHQITTIVDSGSALNLSPEYADFINMLNPEIERLNNQFHHARHDIAAAQPAPIPPQPYANGGPVTPMPQVLYVTPKETLTLELGKDYNLSYRDNREVGNAYCIIHGKGAYRGSKTVTFVIIRGA
jgi:hypothetical protein